MSDIAICADWGAAMFRISAIDDARMEAVRRNAELSLASAADHECVEIWVVTKDKRLIGCGHGQERRVRND